MQRILSLIYFCLCIIASVSCQAQIETERLKSLNNYLQLAEAMGFDGQVLIGCQDKIILNKNLGVINDDANQKVNGNTVFGIASISKQFTAAAILKLVEENKLSTQTKLSDIFSHEVPDDKKNITVHELLTHTSGLTGMDIIGDFEAITGEELFQKITASEIEYKSGENWRYSNVGYNLLAFIIEKLSNQSYESFLETYFFKPLDMKYTGIVGGVLEKYDANNIAYAQRGNEINGNLGDWEFNWRTFGGGNIYSTTEDLFKWKLALFNNKVVSSNLKDELFKLHYQRSNTEFYGYGWFVFPQTSKGGKLIEHGGDTYLGYNGGFYNYVESGITILILNNTYETFGAHLWDRWSIFYKIRDILFDDTFPIFKNIEKKAVNMGGIYNSLNTSDSVTIENLNDKLLIASNNWKVINDLLGVEDSLSINCNLVYDKLTKHFSKLTNRDFSGYDDLLKDKAKDYGEDYKNEWEELVRNYGNLKSYDFLAITPDFFDPTIRAYVKLDFETSTYYMVYRFLDNGKGRLSGTTPTKNMTIKIPFVLKDDTLEHYNLWTDKKSILNIENNNLDIKNTIYKKRKDND